MEGEGESDGLDEVGKIQAVRLSELPGQDEQWAMTRAEAEVAADDRGERAEEAAGLNVACRRERKAEIEITLYFPGATRDIDSSRAGQAESSRSSMPLRWQHGRESQQGITLSRRQRFRPALALAWRGADLQ
jgi:hypothetical protein